MSDSLSESLKRVEALRRPEVSRVVAPLSKEVLRQVAENQTAPNSQRREALLSLADRFAIEPDFSACVLTLLEDQDPEIVHEAIKIAPPFDLRIIARIRDFLDDPRQSIWEAAASALARRKDHTSLNRMLTWARRGDRVHRRVGLAAIAFLLIPEQHLLVVESICEDGPRDDEDEAVLIDALRVAESRMAFWKKNALNQSDDEE